jgi:hypothetical protein
MGGESDHIVIASIAEFHGGNILTCATSHNNTVMH